MSFPDRQTVLDFLADNPHVTTRRDIARALKLKGKERAALRDVLKGLEEEGRLERTGRRSFAQAETPPPTGVVDFLHLDEEGELIGRCVGRDGHFGPDLLYAGPAHRTGGRGRAGIRAPGIGERGLCQIAERGGGWQARLIKLFEKREAGPLIGLFTSTRQGGRIESASRKDKRDILVRASETGGAESGDLVRAEVKMERGHGPRHAVVREIIGRANDPRAASLISIHAHGIPTEFPEAALKQAREAKPAKAEREDLTAVPLITIDPEDARDHDDAVFAEKLADGWRVIVAIADVAAYVTEGSPLDREAWARGNSTYFPDRVVPMLPFDLSADACSLREGELRRCLAVEMEFDTSGTKRTHRFIRGMMRSAGKLSYEEAQAAVDGRPKGRAAELLEPVLKPLWGAYLALAKARDRRGPLDLDLPEHRIEFDESGAITGISAKQRLEAHRLIEEFMIQANVAAAETLEKARTPFLYRVHDVPSDAKLAAFADFLKTLKRKWPLGERPQTSRFNRLLAEIEGTDEADMIRDMVLRSQAQAVYSPDNLGHFGLNLTRYAHFTSPIRRYADLIVHRALIRAGKLGEDGLGSEAIARLDETAAHLSMTERRSMAAEREAADRYMALYLADRVGAEFAGRVAGVNKAGLFIRLDDTSADGFAPISTLSEAFWVFDEAAMALIERGSGQRYDLGQPVRVRLKEVTPLQGGLLFEVLSPPRRRRKGEPAPKRERHVPRRGGRRRGR